MRMALEDLPGHEGRIQARLADGSLVDATAGDPAERFTAFVGACSCGWAAGADRPPLVEGRWAATSDWAVHMKPLWVSAAPTWLLNRASGLREDVADLAERWPLQALGVLAELERWQKPLLEGVVAAAREAGVSWADIGAALGITRQSAHQRFSAAVRGRAGE